MNFSKPEIEKFAGTEKFQRYSKAFLVIFFLIAAVFGNLSAQEQAGDNFWAVPADGEEAGAEGTVFYSFFVNVVSEPFAFPLIGLVNVARGDHRPLQLGLVNLNTGNFSGLQTGLANIARSFNGAQIGLVNIATRGSRGLQLGLVNYVDSMESGLPIGLISVVRQGGYRVVEFGFSDFFHFSMGLKLGVERFYTTIFAAYNSVDEFAIEHFGTGLGFGSIFNITRLFFFNPELNNFAVLASDANRQFLSFVSYFGFNLGQNFSIAFGPSATWIWNWDDVEPPSPLFTVAEYTINNTNSIVIGARAALRFHF
jgi:hypothetical protein